MNPDGCMAREPWELAFPAEPRNVADLRAVRLHLKSWGLPRQIEAAQLCVSELVTHVIRHVGMGAPKSLRLSMNGTYAWIEVSDARGLFEIAPAIAVPEEGRAGIWPRWWGRRPWGVLVGVDRKIAVIEMIVDLPRWTQVHGCDAGDVLDSTQVRFDALP
ncbi:hypothetical protein [Streptomyces sp. NK15101]|uniref:ATP-binding protein n=1 Tax=Streptomyces sp. NK15101 TaxID=2873261 RepID=UPI001CED183A|nr:hypothetical protein [Streptomyces sp. NK15101]